MFIQVEKPNYGDPFFNNASGGGISTAITAKPTYAEGLNVLPNCVGCAVGAYNKAACKDLNKPEFKYLSHPPNAENILARAEQEHLPISQKPDVGALIVWQKGTLSGSDGAGHVAFVNKVDADGTIHTSESEWQGRVWVNRTYKPPYNYGNGYKFIGFVLQPGGSSGVRSIRKGDTGADVELMQARLHALGYMRKSEIDGDFGRITLGAVCAFQLENKLEVDGICGPKTQAALYK